MCLTPCGFANADFAIKNDDDADTDGDDDDTDGCTR